MDSDPITKAGGKARIGVLPVLHKVEARMLDVHILAMDEKSPRKPIQQVPLTDLCNTNIDDQLGGLKAMGDLLKSHDASHGQAVLCHGDIKGGITILFPSEGSEALEAGVIKGIDGIAVEMALIASAKRLEPDVELWGIAHCGAAHPEGTPISLFEGGGEPAGTDGPCIRLYVEHVSKPELEDAESGLPLGVTSCGMDEIADGIKGVGVVSGAFGKISGGILDSCEAASDGGTRGTGVYEIADSSDCGGDCGLCERTIEEEDEGRGCCGGV